MRNREFLSRARSCFIIFGEALGGCSWKTRERENMCCEEFCWLKALITAMIKISKTFDLKHILVFTSAAAIILIASFVSQFSVLLITHRYETRSLSMTEQSIAPRRCFKNRTNSRKTHKNTIKFSSWTDRARGLLLSARNNDRQASERREILVEKY